MAHQKMTGTHLRTPQTMKIYFDMENKRKANPAAFPPFNPYERERLKDFNHWFIINNDFPYDGIATTSHIIFTKRHVAFSWDLLTQEEREELDALKKGYISDTYEVIYENLPTGQTKPGHFHLHLMVLKRYEI